MKISVAKSRVCHRDEGFVFLGFHIQRRLKKGTRKMSICTYRSKKSLLTILGKVRTLTRRSEHPSLEALLRRLNPVARGWCNYFRHGVSKAGFGYLDAFIWHRTQWIRKRHLGITWRELYRRLLTGRPGNQPQAEGITMFDT